MEPVEMDALIDGALAYYGPALGVVAAAAFGATRVVRAAWASAPSWALRLVSLAVGAAGGVLVWGREGLPAGILAGALATGVVAAARRAAGGGPPP